MMRRAWTAVGLSCVVVATTVAGVEDPTAKTTGATKDAVGKTTTSNDLDRRLPSDLSVADIEPLMQLARDAANRNVPGSPFARTDPNQELSFNLETLAEVMAQPARSKEVRPAVVVPKKPTNELRIPIDHKTGKDLATGRLKFKFVNSLKARAPMVPGDRLISLTGADLGNIERIIAEHNGLVRQLIMKSPQEMSQIENKAFQTSNRIQPDLASMMLVEFPTKDLDNLLALARALNEEDTIEWVSIGQEIKIGQEDVAGCNAQNPDFCFEPSKVEEAPPARMGPLGDGGIHICWNPTLVDDQHTPGLVPGMCNPDPGCDELFSPCIFGCNDIGCCNEVGAVLPYCIDEDSPFGWDTLCAALANLLCGPTKYTHTPPPAPNPYGEYDPCLSAYQPNQANPPQPVLDGFNQNPIFANAAFILLEPCTEASTFAGCNDTRCCVAICKVNPHCCEQQWDTTCATIALTNPAFTDDCLVSDPSETPDFTSSEAEDLFPGANIPNIAVGAQAWMVQTPATNRQNPPLGPGNSANFEYGGPAPAPIYTVDDYRWSPNPDSGGQQGNPILNSSFLLSGFAGGGFDVPGVERLTGVIWANYGGGGHPQNQVLPNPTKVWLYGRQYEVVNVQTGCRGADQVYDCADCLTPSQINDRYPHFYSGASTLDPTTGIDHQHSRLCPTGKQLNGAVIEFAAYVNHEEFVCQEQNPQSGACTSHYLQPRVITEPGQTVLLAENSVNSPDHGTACLGIMLAGDNGFGVRGMASEAQGWFFPSVSLEEGARLATAITSAIQHMGPGSVINMSIGFGGGNVITSQPEYYALAVVASDALIVVCESAGNDSLEVQEEAGDGSGAIIVGAQTPGAVIASTPGACDFFIQRRMATCFWGSNWSQDGLVPVCAWGTAVATIGYGDAFNGTCSPSPGGPELERNKLRSYTAPVPNNSGGGFSGTSAASPQIAGAAMWMQGFADTFYGEFLTSAQVGAVLSSAVSVNCSDFLGNDIPPCPDFDPEQELHPVGGLPSIYDCALNILVRLDADFNGKVTVYTGTHISGGTFALGQVDGNTFKVRSELAAQGPGPADLGYLGTGSTIDFGVMFDSGFNTDEVMTARIDMSCAASGAGGQAGPGIVLMIPWVKDTLSQRYVPLAVEFLTANLDPFTADLGLYLSPQTFFDSAGRVDARFYQLNLGYLGSASYTGMWDYLELIVNDPNVPNDP